MFALTTVITSMSGILTASSKLKDIFATLTEPEKRRARVAKNEAAVVVATVCHNGQFPQSDMTYLRNTPASPRTCRDI